MRSGRGDMHCRWRCATGNTNIWIAFLFLVLLSVLQISFGKQLEFLSANSICNGIETYEPYHVGILRDQIVLANLGSEENTTMKFPEEYNSTYIPSLHLHEANEGNVFIWFTKESDYLEHRIVRFELYPTFSDGTPDNVAIISTTQEPVLMKACGDYLCVMFVNASSSTLELRDPLNLFVQDSYSLPFTDVIVGVGEYSSTDNNLYFVNYPDAASFDIISVSLSDGQTDSISINDEPLSFTILNLHHDAHTNRLYIVASDRTLELQLYNTAPPVKNVIADTYAPFAMSAYDKKNGTLYRISAEGDLLLQQTLYWRMNYASFTSLPLLNFFIVQPTTPCNGGQCVDNRCVCGTGRTGSYCEQVSCGGSTTCPDGTSCVAPNACSPKSCQIPQRVHLLGDTMLVPIDNFALRMESALPFPYTSRFVGVSASHDQYTYTVQGSVDPPSSTLLMIDMVNNYVVRNVSLSFDVVSSIAYSENMLGIVGMDNSGTRIEVWNATSLNFVSQYDLSSSMLSPYQQSSCAKDGMLYVAVVNNLDEHRVASIDMLNVGSLVTSPGEIFATTSFFCSDYYSNFYVVDVPGTLFQVDFSTSPSNIERLTSVDEIFRVSTNSSFATSSSYMDLANPHWYVFHESGNILIYNAENRTLIGIDRIVSEQGKLFNVEFFSFKTSFEPLCTCFGVEETYPAVCDGHGSCEDMDTCACETGYHGTSCLVSSCFGIFSNSTDVCSSRGDCYKYNQCRCPFEYIGDECEVTFCSGVLSNESFVCSSHGSCVDWNNCQCEEGYDGEQCEITTCFGIEQSEPSACSGRGQCVAPNFCDCNTGYTGSECELNVCFGMSQTNAFVCSGRGQCVDADVCDCNTGYTGSVCELNACFGIEQTNSTVCSGRGQCVGPNLCDCNTGYTGSECDLNACFGIEQTNSTVCSGRGQCVGPNLCDCDDGYDGQECDLATCFDITQTDPSVCSGHGTCVGADACSCDTGYTSVTCSDAVCFNVSASSTRVCSGKGTCTDVDTCDCSSGYTGSQCESNLCFGIAAFNYTVCSSRGQCVDADLCQCDEGYTGVECSEPECFLIPTSSEYSCSGHGDCVSPDNCQCETGYSGDECQEITCFSVEASNQTVCNGNGVCSAVDTCDCSDQYSGLECNIPLCFEKQAGASGVCSSHGTCSAPDDCTCSSGWTGDDCSITSCYGVEATDFYACSAHGTCVSPDSCDCDEDFFGNDCSLTSCYDVNSNDTNVCNGHGVCSSPDNCVCSEGFSNDQCQDYFCNGIHYSDPSVCNGRGICESETRTCTCDAGYDGSYCNLYSCFGKASKNSDVCFGHGTCEDVDTCNCASGYTGTQCGSFTCYGVVASDPSACGAHGVCSDVDSCECDPGYTGPQCQYPICFQEPSNIESVCSGHGSCDAPDSCSCATGHSGLKCGLNICFGVLSNESTVCSGHGSCEAPESCLCDDGFFGLSCDDYSCFFYSKSSPGVCSGHGTCDGVDSCTCSSGYFGEKCNITECYDVLETSPSVCSGHGICAGKDNCQCDPGIEGDDCSSPICYGESTATNDTLPCNGYDCVAPDQCACTGFAKPDCSRPICFGESDSRRVCSRRGTCTSPDTCSCDSSFYGDQCEYRSEFFLDMTSATSSFVTGVDDYTTSQLTLNTDKFKFYGNVVKRVRIGENGFMSFGSNFNSYRVDMSTYSGPDPVILFGLDDMDLRGVGKPNRVYWRQSSNVPTTGELADLQKITTLVQNTYQQDVDLSQFTADWFWATSADQIGYYPSKTDMVNSVQVILTVDSMHDLSFVIFNFKDDGITYPSQDPLIGLLSSGGTSDPVNIMDTVDPTGKQASKLALDSNVNRKGLYMYPTHMGGTVEVIAECYGILANESDVCSGFGECTDDGCICQQYHSGNECEISCVNQTQYSGEFCENTLCFGIEDFERSVCSGHGICNGPDLCNCAPNFSGDECEEFTCFGIDQSSPDVCGGHGKCSSPDTCICDQGWVKNTSLPINDCSQYTCDGNRPDEPNACANGGDCIGLDKCTGCEIPFFGEDCLRAYRYVDAVNGNDSSSNLCLFEDNPCKTIEKAVSEATVNNIISFASGTYTLPLQTIYLSEGVSFAGQTDDVIITTSPNQPRKTSSFIVFMEENVSLNFKNIQLKNIRSKELVRYTYVRNPSISFDGITADNIRMIASIQGQTQLSVKNSTFSNVQDQLIWASAESSASNFINIANVSISHFSKLSAEDEMLGMIHAKSVATVTLDNVQMDNIKGYTSGVHVSQASEVRLNSVTWNDVSSTSGTCALSLKEALSVSVDMLSVSNCETASGSAIDIQDVDEISFSGQVSFNSLGLTEGSSLLLKQMNDVTIPYLRVSDVVAYGDGGGLYIEDINLTIEKASFSSMVGTSGTAIYGEDASLTLGASTFSSIIHTENTIEPFSAKSGVILMTGSGIISIDGGEFSNNHLPITISGEVATRINNTIFTDNEYGAIQFITNTPSSYVLIQNSQFIRNSNENGFGGAITVLEGVFSLVVSQSSFMNCSSINGGAISMITASNLLLSGCDFDTNSATSTSSLGGAIYLEDLNTTTISGSTFTNNVAYSGGGAVSFKSVLMSRFFLRYGGSMLVNSTFINNRATFGDGGALHFSVENIATIKSCVFGQNIAFQYGGAIYGDGSLLSSVLQGSLDSFLETASFADLLYLGSTNGLIIKRSEFSENFADSGGALATFSDRVNLAISYSTFTNNQASTEGGTTFFLAMNVDITNTNIMISSARRGGCIYAFVVDGGVTIRNSSISQCETERQGSIYMSSGVSLSFNNSTLSDSTSLSGSIYSQSNVFISGSTIRDNTVSRNGGAVALELLGSLSAHHSVFENNIAADGGGAISTTSYEPISITYSSLIRNTAKRGGGVFLGHSSSNTNSIPDERPVSMSNTNVSCHADVGGSFFSMTGGEVDWVQLLDSPGMTSSSTVTRESPILGYGPDYASNPASIRLKSLIRYDIANDGSSMKTELNTTVGDGFILFPGQEVDIRLAFIDVYDQVVSYYEGLTMEITSLSRLRSPSVEKVIENEEVQFSGVQVFGIDSTQVTLSGSIDDVTLNINFAFATCPYGYRLVETEDGCELCPRGSYNLRPGSKVCYSNCENFACAGGSTISYDSGYWIDISPDGYMRPLPCVNGKCAGGDFKFMNSIGTDLPFDTTTSASSSMALFDATTTNTSTLTDINYSKYTGSDCRDNRQGILCAECAEGYELWRGSCLRCQGTSFLLIGLYLLYSIAIIVYVHRSSQNDDDGASDKILVSFMQTAFQTVDFSTWASKQANSLSLLGVIGQFAQAVFNLEIPNLSGPDSSVNTNDGAPPTNNNFWEQCPFWRPGYWYFSTQLMQHMLTVIMILVAMVLCFALFKCCSCIRKIKAKKKKKAKEGKATSPELAASDESSESTQSQPKQYEELLFETEERKQKEVEEEKANSKQESLPKRIFHFILSKFLMIIDRYLFPHAFFRTFLNILIYTYMPVVSVTFSFLLGCFSTSRGSWLLIERTDLNCWTSSEYWVWSLFFFPAFFYVLLGPIILFLFLRLNKKRLHNDRFYRYFGTLYNLYTPQCYWFEMVGFARRVLLIASSIISNVLILSFDISGVQYTLYTTIIAANLIFLIRYNPYQNEGDNKVDKLATFMLFVMLCVQEGGSDVTESVGMVLGFAVMVATLVVLVYWVFRENTVVKKVVSLLSKLRAKISSVLHKPDKKQPEDTPVDKYAVDMTVGNFHPGDQTTLTLNNYMKEMDVSSHATTEDSYLSGDDSEDAASSVMTAHDYLDDIFEDTEHEQLDNHVNVNNIRQVLKDVEAHTHYPMSALLQEEDDNAFLHKLFEKTSGMTAEPLTFNPDGLNSDYDAVNKILAVLWEDVLEKTGAK